MNQKAIGKIKENTKIAEDILFKVVNSIKPNITTYELNQIAKKEFEKKEVLPSAKFLGSDYYISVAINEEVLFGKISKNKKIKNGDVVKIALGVFKDGYFSDLGFTFIAGKPSPEKSNLIKGTAKSLFNTIQDLKSGVAIQEISSIIENTLKKYNLNPICEIMGHGIGKNLHQPPSIPNCKNMSFIDYAFKLKSDTIICIEPIATTGSGKVIRKNKMSFITKDKQPSVHFEFPVLIKKDGAEIIGKKIFKFIEKISLMKSFQRDKISNPANQVLKISPVKKFQGEARAGGQKEKGVWGK